MGGDRHEETEKRSGCTIFAGLVSTTRERPARCWIVELDTSVSGAWNIVFLRENLVPDKRFQCFPLCVRSARNAAPRDSRLELSAV